MNDLKTAYQNSQEAILKDFFHFLSIPSISSEIKHKQDVLNCANWVYNYLKDMGMEAKLWETKGYPVVFASWLEAGPKQPTILIYNHYDVQPVDPLEAWDTPPFSPTLKNGDIYARGAQDNKGQCFYVLQALKLLFKQNNGKLPVNVKVIIEGEEESGSFGLDSILEKRKEELKADYLAIVDVGIPSKDEPALTLGYRGITTMDVEAQGSVYDLHSGIHGGIVFNPIHGLIELLGKLRDKEGKIAVPGFYNDVAPVSEEDKKMISFDFNSKKFHDEFGAEASGGEKAFSPNERAWLRPTIEINGIIGGYTGDGFKTVIPAKAHAKISCRLVPNQVPQKIGKLVADFLEANAPNGISIRVHVHNAGGPALRVPSSSPLVQAFSNAYQTQFSKPCKFIMDGGSIPVVSNLSKASQAEVVLVGLGLPGDRIHAPNERFSVDRLEKGALIIAQALENLAIK